LEAEVKRLRDSIDNIRTLIVTRVIDGKQTVDLLTQELEGEDSE
jgi:hypothetical protein